MNRSRIAVLLVASILSCALSIAAAPDEAAADRDAADIMGSLRLGWNLGNALDAPGDERAWGNPTVDRSLLVAVKREGFDLVRIPVTWSPHLGEGPDYTIDPDRLQRVEEVVRYAKQAGLRVVLNVHHDGAQGLGDVRWLRLTDAEGKTTEANNQAVERQFVAVWEQIAAHFADHGNWLMFESMNEVHDGYGPADPRHVAFINRLNQRFVDVVRAAGGENPTRCLVVPGYNTNIDATLDGFVLPDDPARDRLIVSVHFYDPYKFALTAETHTWGAGAEGRDDFGQEADVLRQFRPPSRVPSSTAACRCCWASTGRRTRRISRSTGRSTPFSSRGRRRSGGSCPFGGTTAASAAGRRTSRSSTAPRTGSRTPTSSPPSSRPRASAHE